METINLSYKANLDELQNLLGISEEFLENHGSTMKNTMNINIAIEEIFVNIASYAYPDIENKGAEITIGYEDDVFSIEFVDWGIPFDPLAKQDPDISESAEERPIGGLGIYMVKKTMSDVYYRREDGKNIFGFSKNIKE